MSVETTMTNVRVLATGLRFPEGPVALPNGDVIVTELLAGRLTRVAADGTVSVVAELGGSPNGCAIGPDGAAYVCNSGGFAHQEVSGFLVPQGVHHESQPEDYSGGRIERVDLETGDSKVLYDSCDGNKLIGPNDIVFDAEGGFWFTDHGKSQRRTTNRGGIYYARPDGSSITEVIYPIDGPNGIGLSPDGATLYAAETPTGRLYAWDVVAPGKLAEGQGGGTTGARLVAGLPGNALFDSLGVEADGNVCVATIMSAGISVISPEGEVALAALPMEAWDLLPTNICWGGDDLKTACITCSSTQRLIAADWPRAGLPLHFLNK